MICITTYQPSQIWLLPQTEVKMDQQLLWGREFLQAVEEKSPSLKKLKMKKIQDIEKEDSVLRNSKKKKPRDFHHSKG